MISGKIIGFLNISTGSKPDLSTVANYSDLFDSILSAESISGIEGSSHNKVIDNGESLSVNSLNTPDSNQLNLSPAVSPRNDPTPAFPVEVFSNSHIINENVATHDELVRNNGEFISNLSNDRLFAYSLNDNNHSAGMLENKYEFLRFGDRIIIKDNNTGLNGPIGQNIDVEIGSISICDVIADAIKKNQGVKFVVSDNLSLDLIPITINYNAKESSNNGGEASQADLADNIKENIKISDRQNDKSYLLLLDNKDKINNNAKSKIVGYYKMDADAIKNYKFDTGFVNNIDNLGDMINYDKTASNHANSLEESERNLSVGEQIGGYIDENKYLNNLKRANIDKNDSNIVIQHLVKMGFIIDDKSLNKYLSPEKLDDNYKEISHNEAIKSKVQSSGSFSDAPIVERVVNNNVLNSYRKSLAGGSDDNYDGLNKVVIDKRAISVDVANNNNAELYIKSDNNSHSGNSIERSDSCISEEFASNPKIVNSSEIYINRNINEYSNSNIKYKLETEPTVDNHLEYNSKTSVKRKNEIKGKSELYDPEKNIVALVAPLNNYVAIGTMIDDNIRNNKQYEIHDVANEKDIEVSVNNELIKNSALNLEEGKPETNRLNNVKYAKSENEVKGSVINYNKNINVGNSANANIYSVVNGYGLNSYNSYGNPILSNGLNVESDDKSLVKLKDESPALSNTQNADVQYNAGDFKNSMAPIGNERIIKALHNKYDPNVYAKYINDADDGSNNKYNHTQDNVDNIQDAVKYDYITPDDECNKKEEIKNKSDIGKNIKIENVKYNISGGDILNHSNASIRITNSELTAKYVAIGDMFKYIKAAQNDNVDVISVDINVEKSPVNLDSKGYGYAPIKDPAGNNGVIIYNYSAQKKEDDNINDTYDGKRAYGKTDKDIPIVAEYISKTKTEPSKGYLSKNIQEKVAQQLNSKKNAQYESYFNIDRYKSISSGSDEELKEKNKINKYTESISKGISISNVTESISDVVTDNETDRATDKANNNAKIIKINSISIVESPEADSQDNEINYTNETSNDEALATLDERAVFASKADSLKNIDRKIYNNAYKTEESKNVAKNYARSNISKEIKSAASITKAYEIHNDYQGSIQTTNSSPNYPNIKYNSSVETINKDSVSEDKDIALYEKMSEISEYENNDKYIYTYTKSDAKPEVKSDVKPDTKSDVQLDTKSDVKLDTRPDVKTDTRPDVKTDTRPDVKTDARPDVKTDAKPDVKPDEQSDINNDLLNYPVRSLKNYDNLIYADNTVKDDLKPIINNAETNKNLLHGKNNNEIIHSNKEEKTGKEILSKNMVGADAEYAIYKNEKAANDNINTFNAANKKYKYRVNEDKSAKETTNAGVNIGYKEINSNYIESNNEQTDGKSSTVIASIVDAIAQDEYKIVDDATNDANITLKKLVKQDGLSNNESYKINLHIADQQNYEAELGAINIVEKSWTSSEELKYQTSKQIASASASNKNETNIDSDKSNVANVKIKKENVGIKEYQGALPDNYSYPIPSQYKENGIKNLQKPYNYNNRNQEVVEINNASVAVGKDNDGVFQTRGKTDNINDKIIENNNNATPTNEVGIKYEEAASKNDPFILHENNRQIFNQYDNGRKYDVSNSNYADINDAGNNQGNGDAGMDKINNIPYVNNINETIGNANPKDKKQGGYKTNDINIEEKVKRPEKQLSKKNNEQNPGNERKGKNGIGSANGQNNIREGYNENDNSNQDIVFEKPLKKEYKRNTDDDASSAKNDISDNMRDNKIETTKSEKNNKNNEIKIKNDNNASIETAQQKTATLNMSTNNIINKKNNKTTLNYVGADNIREYIVNLAENTKTGSSSSAVLRLKPESLGNITLKVSAIGNLIGIKIEVETNEAKNAVISQISSLKENMSKSGINIQNLEIKQNQDATSGQYDESSGKGGRNNENEQRHAFLRSFRYYPEKTEIKVKQEKRKKERPRNSNIIEKYI